MQITRTASSKLMIAAWPLLLFSFAAGMSVQTIGAWAVILAAVLSRSWPEKLPRYVALYVGILLLMLTWMTLATLINEKNPANSRVVEYVVGYLPLVLLPVFLLKHDPKPHHRSMFLVVSILAIICLSQVVLGWSLHELSGGLHYRPHGLYGHPLTLAYSTLLIWPIAVYWWWRDLRCWRGWVMLGCVGLILLAVDSRSCQVAAVIAAIAYLLPRFTWRQRGLFLTLVGITTAIVFYTDNPVSDRYRTTFSEDNPQRFSDYPDDRIAFWHAHYLMIKERPVLGHGTRLNRDYRQAYYEKIGLGDFIRRYSAHNLYIQVTAEGGLVGIALFLIWGAILWRITGHIDDKDKRSMFRIMLIAFALASITQNSLMDATVRNVFTAVIAWIFYEAHYGMVGNSEHLGSAA